MNYVLVNHVPFAFSKDATRVRTAPAMLADVRAQAAALAEAGLRLLVAAPVLPAAHPAARGCVSDEFSPDELGFELLHLPVYQSMRDYLRRKEKLAAALREHLAVAEVAQLGYGGHPMMLGEVAWPIAHAAGARLVWMFDSVDPFERMHQNNRTDRNPVRRLARQRLIEHKRTFCRNAVAKADLVIAHHPAIKDHFAEAWDSHCRLLDAPLFDADMLPSEADLAARHLRTTDKQRAIRFLAPLPANGQAPVDHLVRALTHCRRLSVPVGLTLVAEPAQATPVLKLADELAMREYLQRCDPPSDMAGWLKLSRDADAMLSVSQNGEIIPAALASMACGLPVVAYENLATDRLIETTEAGAVVPHDNVLLLAQALLDLHRDRGQLTRLGESAWRYGQTRTLQANHRLRADLIVSRLLRRARSPLN